jgi:hypothetical protein
MTMLVTCTANTGRALPATYLVDGYSVDSIFDVVIGKDYPVFGMALWKSRILLLLSDESELPNWCPLELFSVKDPRLPEDWVFGVYQTHEHEVQAIWGYERLVVDHTHWEALLERNPGALRIFLQEKHKRHELFS